ncbi:hypothetical protein [uncultured Draconibacterium sp.]|uniref:hypothetical protein n=1 Tax=uncultured Draconibacterium sp. TaxID=1573823 RepID=UPI0032180E2F
MKIIKELDMFSYLKIYTLLLVVVLFSACTGTSKKTEKSENRSTTIDSRKFETKSGKLFVVHIDHSFGVSLNEVRIETINFAAANEVYKLGTIDPVERIFLADIDNNGFEELYLVTRSGGSGSYSTIYGIASNKDKSATPIYVPPISEKQQQAGELFEGFLGHNKFSIENGRLVNEFPVYVEGDTNAKATGGLRKIKYKLVTGEAGWILNPGTKVDP